MVALATLRQQAATRRGQQQRRQYGRTGDRDQRRRAQCQRTATPPAPAMPPTLYMPWNPDIIARPLARSTITACRFITTSSTPRLAPNTANAAASTGIEGVGISAGRHRQITVPAARIVRRQPKRAASPPASGIISTEPTPRQSSISPSCASSRASLRLANGISGAQADGEAGDEEGETGGDAFARAGAVRIRAAKRGRTLKADMPDQGASSPNCTASPVVAEGAIHRSNRPALPQAEVPSQQYGSRSTTLAIRN